MQTIRLIAIKEWEQLYLQLETVDPHQVNLWNFMVDSTSDLPYESNRAYWDFSGKLIEILMFCPDELKEPLQTVFFSKTSRRNDIGQTLCEIPLRKIYNPHDWELDWNWVDFALNPSSVSAIALAASQCNIGEYRPYFMRSQRSYFDSFEQFEEYANCWMAHFEEAHKLDAGLICYCL